MVRRRKKTTKYEIYNGVELGDEFGGVIYDNSRNKAYIYSYKDPKTNAHKTKYLGRNLNDAVRRYEEAKAKLYGKKPNVEFLEYNAKPKSPRKQKQIDNKIADDGKIVVAKEVSKIDGDYQRLIYDNVYEIPEKFILDQFTKMLANPQELARKLGLKDINLEALKPKPAPLTLKKIGDLYFNRHLYRPDPPLTKGNLKNSKNWWKEFCKIIKVNTVDQISLELINYYQNELHEVATSEVYRPNWLSPLQKKTLKDVKASPTWVKHRLDKIKTILRNVKNTQSNLDDVNTALEHCYKFHYLAPTDFEPNPISREDFKALLKVVNPKENNGIDIVMKAKWRAILLLALNGAVQRQL